MPEFKTRVPLPTRGLWMLGHKMPAPLLMRGSQMPEFKTRVLLPTQGLWMLALLPTRDSGMRAFRVMPVRRPTRASLKMLVRLMRGVKTPVRRSMPEKRSMLASLKL